MACKVRLHGLPEEVEAMLVSFQEDERYEILSQSKIYEDRNSEYIRMYLEVRLRG